MTLAVFGLSVSSSFGNGHATLWRGLARGLHRLGHTLTFFEKDEPYYAAHRDLTELPGLKLILYSNWKEVRALARRYLAGADVAMATSYCPDGPDACELVLSSPAPVRAFYDLDTPITLARLDACETVPYLPSRGLGDFDIVLSYTGGAALDALRERLGAKRVAPLYGSVDPEAHSPAGPRPEYTGDLSYLGTYAEDRQPALEALFVEAARRLPQRRFVIGGSQYPAAFPWQRNIYYLAHVPPREHPAFYCSSRLTLNVTRGAMAAMGYCPSGRLFEAAACGTPVLSDWWEGLGEFFNPGEEILIARNTEDATGALSLSDREIARVAIAARERTLACHTAEKRAAELEAILEGARSAASPREVQ